MKQLIKLLLIFFIGQPLQESFAHFFFEVDGGGMLSRAKIKSITTQSMYNVQGLTTIFKPTARKLSPEGTGGFKLGWWPKHRGQSMCDTAWYEYFGFYFDMQFNNLKYDHCLDTKVCYTIGSATACGKANLHLLSKGFATMCAGMFAIRYGFFANESNSMGLLQPYVAVGPAGLFTHQKVHVTVYPHDVDGNFLTIMAQSVQEIETKKHWSCAPCFALDGGLRWFVHHAFIDFFFNYRFSPMHISQKYTQPLRMDQRYRFFNFGAGFGYEF